MNATNKALGICPSIVTKSKVTNTRNLASNKKSQKKLALTIIDEREQKELASTPPKKTNKKQKSTCKKKVRKENVTKPQTQVKAVKSQRATQYVGAWLNQSMKCNSMAATKKYEPTSRSID